MTFKNNRMAVGTSQKYISNAFAKDYACMLNHEFVLTAANNAQQNFAYCYTATFAKKL